MIISLLKFFISPTNSVDKVKGISTNYKFVIILASILISTAISNAFTLFGILPFGFDIMSYLIAVLFAIVFNFIFTGIIYGVGTHLKNKIQGNFIDNLFFIILSSLIFGFSPIILYLMAENGLFALSFLGTLFFLGWALVLMSKSLAKLNTISEGKVTLLVIVSLVIMYTIDYLVPFSIFGLVQNQNSNFQEKTYSSEISDKSQFSQDTKGIQCNHLFFEISAYMAPVSINGKIGIANMTDTELTRHVEYYTNFEDIKETFGFRWSKSDLEGTYLENKSHEEEFGDLLSYYQIFLDSLELQGLKDNFTCKEWQPNIELLVPSNQVNFGVNLPDISISNI